MSFDRYSKDNPNLDGLEKAKYEEDLNIIYTKKILNTIVNDAKDKIDKVYINTYDYLLANGINS